MAEVESAAPASAAPAKKATKKASAGKPKTPASHPKYSDMIVAAITSLKDRTGSSSQAIKKYIIANYKVDEKTVGPQLRMALRRGVTAGQLKQVKGTGASGSFKVADNTKPDKAAKSPKKTVKKTTTAKKPATKKAAKSPKKAAKTSVKKTTAAKKSPKKSTKKVAKSPAKPKVKKAVKKPAAKKAQTKK